LFIGYKITESLGNKLPRDEIQKANLCPNKHRYGSTSRHD